MINIFLYKIAIFYGQYIENICIRSLWGNSYEETYLGWVDVRLSFLVNDFFTFGFWR